MYVTIFITALTLLCIGLFVLLRIVAKNLLMALHYRCIHCDSLFCMNTPLGEGRTRCPGCGYKAAIVPITGDEYYRLRVKGFDYWVQSGIGIICNMKDGRKFDYVQSRFLS